MGNFTTWTYAAVNGQRDREHSMALIGGKAAKEKIEGGDGVVPSAMIT
jgi:hypothetical protein